MTKNLKPWPVRDELRLRLVEKCSASFPTGPPRSELRALEYSLANWHPDTIGRGEYDCGCCEYVSEVMFISMSCNTCPLNPDGEDDCCGGLWRGWHKVYKMGDLAAADIIANKIYDFILEKYWEVRDRLEISNKEKIKKRRGGGLIDNRFMRK